MRLLTSLLSIILVAGNAWAEDEMSKRQWKRASKDAAALAEGTA